MRDIGKNIRRIRMHKGLTQDELAERLFVTRQTISNYETGRSRPDVETLLSLAAALETDANAILYGPPLPPDRRAELRCFAAGLSVAAALGLLLALAWKPADYLFRNEFISGPSILLQIYLLPAFYAILGWTLLGGIFLLTKAKPLQGRSAKIARYVVWGLLSACFVLLLPGLLHDLRSTLLHIFFLDGLQAPLGYSSSFMLRPAWLNRLSQWLSIGIYRRQHLFFLFGALLGLFGFPAKKEAGRKEKTWLLPLLGLFLGLGLYVCAAEEFTVEVENPAQIDHVPYGVQIVVQDQTGTEN